MRHVKGQVTKIHSVWYLAMQIILFSYAEVFFRKPCVRFLPPPQKRM